MVSCFNPIESSCSPEFLTKIALHQHCADTFCNAVPEMFSTTVTVLFVWIRNLLSDVQAIQPGIKFLILTRPI